MARKNEGTEQATEQASKPGTGDALQNPLSVSQRPETALRTAQVSTFENANRELRGTGQHVEALNSDALQQWMRDGNIQEMDGVYYQRTLMPIEQSALLEVHPQREVLARIFPEVINQDVCQLLFNKRSPELRYELRKS